MEVMNQQEFLLLSAEDVFHLLSSDDVNVSSESVIFEAILVWLNRDYAERKKHFHKLLSTVRMPLLPPQYIADQIECHPLLKEDQECYEYVLEAYRYHLLPEYRHFLHTTARARPRKSTVGLLYLMGGMDSNKGALAIESYNFLKDEWEIVCSMNRRRLQFGMARVGQIIYIIGGRDGLKTLALVACWDYRNDGWSNGAPMNNARHGVSVVVMNDIIYAIGGHDSWSYLASAERFDGRVWTPIADMNCARMSCGVAVLDGRIYAVGGRDASSVHKSVECYNPASNRWTFCAEMSRRRAGVGVGVLNGCVYAVGGMDTPENNYCAKRHASVERYDPAVNQWTLIADLSSGRDGIAVCALGSYLFAIGGFNGSTYEDRVEYYDEGEDEWTEVKSLCVGRAGACVTVIPNEGQNANC